MHPVIIDTDIAIDYLRGKIYSRDIIEPLWEQNCAYLSVLSVYELCSGMKNDEKIATFNFIDACHIEIVTSEISIMAADLYKKHRAKGVTINSIDCLITGTAIVKNYKIATKNVSHYPEKNLLIF